MYTWALGYASLLYRGHSPLGCWSGPCHWLTACVAEVVRTCGRSQKGVLRVKITVQSQMRVISEATCTRMHGNMPIWHDARQCSWLRRNSHNLVLRAKNKPNRKKKKMPIVIGHMVVTYAVRKCSIYRHFLVFKDIYN